jgi:sensor histidine kinase YesM
VALKIKLELNNHRCPARHEKDRAGQNKRIQLLHGKEYGVKIESQQGKGTTVNIRLPG